MNEEENYSKREILKALLDTSQKILDNTDDDSIMVDKGMLKTTTDTLKNKVVNPQVQVYNPFSFTQSIEERNRTNNPKSYEERREESYKDRKVEVYSRGLVSALSGVEDSLPLPMKVNSDGLIPPDLVASDLVIVRHRDNTIHTKLVIDVTLEEWEKQITHYCLIDLDYGE